MYANILVVEDHAETLVGTVLELQQFGANVVSVTSLDSAKLKLQGEKFSLILLDWRVPARLNETVDDDAGGDLLEWLRRDSRGINHMTPVLVVTAQKSAVDDRACANARAPVQVISKLRPDQILREASRIIPELTRSV